MRFVLRRLLHGFRESPGIAPGSHGARMVPQRRAFPRRCTGYSFVASIIYAPKVNVNDRTWRNLIAGSETDPALCRCTGMRENHGNQSTLISKRNPTKTSDLNF
jgi:hypothetical protein